MNRFTLTKAERICNKKQFEVLLNSKHTYVSYPIRVIFNYTEATEDIKYNASIAVSVGKKRFKRAVKRNRVKRLIRESYRLHKPEFYDKIKDYHVDLLFVFVGKDLPDYAEIDHSMNILLCKICDKIVRNEHSE